jgi:trehalose 6-phosphate synthase/phosphatase
MTSFLRNIGTVIEEDGEEVLPTTMQPVTIDDFESYLAPYVGNKVPSYFNGTPNLMG